MSALIAAQRLSWGCVRRERGSALGALVGAALRGPCVVVVTMARMNLYLPDALVRRARTVLPPEVSISAILRRALEAELERFEEIEESEPAG